LTKAGIGSKENFKGKTCRFNTKKETTKNKFINYKEFIENE
jgi:hypothetical protein